MTFTPNSKRKFLSFERCLDHLPLVRDSILSSLPKFLEQTIFWLLALAILWKTSIEWLFISDCLLIFAAILELVTISEVTTPDSSWDSALVLIGSSQRSNCGTVEVVVWLTRMVSRWTLDLHQQVGIATAFLIYFSFLSVWSGAKIRSLNQSKLFRTSRCHACLGVSVTGHFGASWDTWREFPHEVSLGMEEFGRPQSWRSNLAEFASDFSENQEMFNWLTKRSRLFWPTICYKCHSGSTDRGRTQARWERIHL